MVDVDRVSNGVEIGVEPVIPDPGPPSPPSAPAVAPAEPMSYQQYQQLSNNNFMKRNVRTKDWTNFAIRDSGEEVEEVEEAVVEK